MDDINLLRSCCCAVGLLWLVGFSVMWVSGEASKAEDEAQQAPRP
jgi:hypothetical protein